MNDATIIYTHTDEAPMLATYSLLPIIQAFTSQAGVEVETRDISLSGRIIAQFADRLPADQQVPDALADRDAAWALGDPGVIERHDALQALASVVFRPPVAGARHALARVLRLRGWLDHDGVPDGQPQRPATDDELLRPALDRLGLLG